MTREEPKRKPREAPPPGWFLRSKGGTPAELVRTSRTTSDGRWLYRLRYNETTGSQEWTSEQLQALDGVRWFDRRPKGLVARHEPQESTAPTQVAG